MKRQITIFAIIFISISLFMFISATAGFFNIGWMSMKTADKQIQKIEKIMRNEGKSDEEIEEVIKVLKESDDIDFRPVFAFKIIVALIGILTGIGLLKLKSWARTTAIILLSMVCLFSIYLLTLIIPAGISGNPPIVIVPFLIICCLYSTIFLTSFKVKEQFK